MPYAKTADLPPAVHNLPVAAQKIFLAVFNSAHDKNPGDEKSAFKQAWGAVENAGYQKNREGKWVKR